MLEFVRFEQKHMEMVGEKEENTYRYSGTN